MQKRMAWTGVVILGAVTASLVAFAAPPALAAFCGGGQGQALLLGCANNTETDSTELLTTSTADPGLVVETNGALGLSVSGHTTGLAGGGNTTGVRGDGGIYGVYGSSGGTGVWGTSTVGTGVYGENTGSTGVGVEGKTAGNGSAVYGLATGSGVGVNGEATTATGTGVFAHSASGTALAVTGTAHFSQSGLALVPSGSKNVNVTMSGVTTASMILATVQQSGGFYVKYAVPSSGSFTIYINKAPTSPKTVKVAYFVLS